MYIEQYLQWRYFQGGQGSLGPPRIQENESNLPQKCWKILEHNVDFPYEVEGQMN